MEEYCGYYEEGGNMAESEDEGDDERSVEEGDCDNERSDGKDKGENGRIKEKKRLGACEKSPSDEKTQGKRRQSPSKQTRTTPARSCKKN
jgi:hypothetical protein